MAINGEARREILPLGQALFQQASLPIPPPTFVERLGWPGGGVVSRRVPGKRPSAGPPAH
jgi:hypothetical protein